MGQDITTNAIVPHNEQGQPDPEGTIQKEVPVIVNLDNVPLELSKRQALINKALDEGNYRLAPPNAMSMLTDLAKGVGHLATEYGPSMVGIGYGAARGAAAGVPLGLPGVVGGGLVGAAMGGMAGRGTTEVIHGLQGQQMEPVTDTMTKGAMTGLQAEAMGMPLKALQVGMGGASTTPWVLNTPRVAAVNEAKARGINLTTAETSGSPFFRTLESISERSLTGSNTFKRFAENQAEQLIQSGEQTGIQFGPPIDAFARSNRFTTALKGRIADVKAQSNQMFENYVNAAGPTSPVDISGLYQAARDIRGRMTILPSLNKLSPSNQILGTLEDIETLQKQGFTTLPLNEVRKIRSTLGDIAYPDRLGGVVIADPPIAAARKLESSLYASLEANATATGTLAQFKEANQFRKVVVGGIEDSSFYKNLIDNDRSLTSLSKSLFNPRDPGMLLDAKTVVSPEGWKMLQQQYWDSVFTESTRISDVGTRGFLGAKFADKLLKDKPIVDILYYPEQAKEIRAFADVARLVDRTAKLGKNDTMGIMVAGGQLVIGSHAAMNIMQGDLKGAAVDAATIVAPWFAAKVFTSPTATQILTKMVQTGKINSNSIAELAKYATRAESIRENKNERPTE